MDYPLDLSSFWFSEHAYSTYYLPGFVPLRNSKNSHRCSGSFWCNQRVHRRSHNNSGDSWDSGVNGVQSSYISQTIFATRVSKKPEKSNISKSIQPISTNKIEIEAFTHTFLTASQKLKKKSKIFTYSKKYLRKRKKVKMYFSVKRF